MTAAPSALRPLLVFSAVLAVTVTVLFAGCQSGDDTTTAKPDGNAPEYCLLRCEQEAEAGTLGTSYQQCLQQCCAAVPSGCQGIDAGIDAPAAQDAAGDSYTNPNPDGSGGPETGSDGGTGDGGCAQPCGNVCCFGTEVCVAGACTTACTTNSECPQSAPCCAIQPNGPSGCVIKNEGQGCACASSSDCPTLGCCAPATNAAGDPVGPYICKPDDGNSYDCCQGVTTTCSGNFCCVTDSNGNDFCSLPCTQDAGGTTCGAANCDPFTFGTFTTTCSGNAACGP